MADNLSIDRRTSALLVMDFQTLIVDNYAADARALLNRTAKLIAAARTAAIPVIYVVVGFRPGYPEVSNRNAAFNGLKASGAFAAGAESAKIHPAVAPLAEEIVVTKHRVSAFAGTDLDLILRANSIETLILTGIMTSGSYSRHCAMPPTRTTDCWSWAIAALIATRKRIGCCWRRSFSGRPRSRRLRNLSRLSGLDGRRVSVHRTGRRLSLPPSHGSKPRKSRSPKLTTVGKRSRPQVG